MSEWLIILLQVSVIIAAVALGVAAVWSGLKWLEYEKFNPEDF